MAKITIKICLSAIALLLLPLTASAAGLGKVTVQSALGQPLRAEVEISSVQSNEADSLTARMAPAQAFRDAGIEVNAALNSMKLAVERRPEGRYVVVLTSITPVNEPFLDLLIELSSSAGRLIREYTFLLDPPEYKAPQAVAAPATPAAPAVTLAQPVEPPKQPEVRTPNPASEKAPVSAPVAPKSKDASTYEVKRGDTLGKIAGANKPDGVSLPQMLIALYRGNKDAFDGDNINRLRAGRILTVPGKDAAAGIDEKESQSLVIAQARDFNEYRRKLGEAVAQAPAEAEGKRRGASGKITAQVDDKAPPVKDQKDQLRLSKADAVQSPGKASSEDLIAKDKALKEANERVADLEKNVKEMQKALEFASRSMADAQKQAMVKAPPPVAPAASKADSPKVAEPVKAPLMDAAKAVSSASKSTESAKVPEAKAPEAGQPAPASPNAVVAAVPVEKVVEAPKGPEAAKSAEAPKAESAKVAPKAVAKVAPPPPPASFTDELLEDPAMLGGAGAVLVGLFGYGAYAYRKKRKSQFENSVMGASTPMDSSSVFGSSGGQNVDTGSSQFQTDFSQSGVGAIDTDEVDPIAEADVYMAYGRDAQAEEILKEALIKDPTRHVVTAKLLEIYAARKDLKVFEASASGLHAATGGRGPEWAKVAALGLTIDASNPLYGGSGAAVLSVEQSVDAASASVPGIDFDLGAVAEQEPTAGAEEGTLAITVPLAEDAPLDLGFDLGESAGATPAAAGNDFTLDAAPIIDAGAVSVEDVAPSAPPLDLGLDINFDLPAEASVAEPPAAVADLGGASIDFDLALGELADKPAEPVASGALDMDLSSISFDLGTPAESAAPLGDARWQEVATKLDLAKAYEEMGDKDGARELLKEVTKEGDAAQQQQAQTILAALD